VSAAQTIGDPLQHPIGQAGQRQAARSSTVWTGSSVAPSSRYSRYSRSNLSNRQPCLSPSDTDVGNPLHIVYNIDIL